MASLVDRYAQAARKGCRCVEGVPRKGTIKALRPGRKVSVAGSVHFREKGWQMSRGQITKGFVKPQRKRWELILRG